MTTNAKPNILTNDNDFVDNKFFDELFVDDGTAPEIITGADSGTDDDDDPMLKDFQNAPSQEELEAQRKAEEATDNSNGENEEEEEEEEEEQVLGSFTEALDSLVSDGVLKVWLDDQGNPEKPISEMTPTEIKVLISENLNSVAAQAAEDAPVELFKALPKEVQDVVIYSLQGGKDVTQLFQQLAQVNETLSLNPEDEKDGITIIRQHLKQEGILDDAAIESEIQSIQDREQVTKYAKTYKEILDKRQAAILEKRLADQAAADRQRIEKEVTFRKNLETSLKDVKDDILIKDPKLMQAIYIGLTEKNYQNSKGKPTNELGYLLEQTQFGEKQNLRLLSKVLYLLKDEQAFMNDIKTELAKGITSKTVEKIKTGNNLGTPRQTAPIKQDNPVTRGLPKKPTRTSFLERS